MFGFLAGGSFIALALNDITWLTFALIAALDLISRDLRLAEQTNFTTGHRQTQEHLAWIIERIVRLSTPADQIT